MVYLDNSFSQIPGEFLGSPVKRVKKRKASYGSQYTRFIISVCVSKKKFLNFAFTLELGTKMIPLLKISKRRQCPKRGQNKSMVLIYKNNKPI